jgi:uncharacterized membrane protein YjgN (DUF898 family)
MATEETLAVTVPGERTEARLAFSGRGGEYFRIWVVNLFLTLITLGIYSAWAKVRKTRYFWQNTSLAGHVFDFHGRPVAILKGRIVALLLLVAYTWSFEFSAAAGLVTIAVLLAAGPWLFVKAQQFKFGNTSFRGLRFGFAASYRDGVRVVGPILLVWFSSTVAAATITPDRIGLAAVLALVSLVTAALVPWMHQRLKAFQHDRATYGDRTFAFAPATAAFYKTYAKGLGLVVAGVLVGVVASAMVAPGPWSADGEAPEWTYLVSGAAFLLVVYVFVWPYFAARLQQVVWSRTTLDDVRFHTDIRAWPLAQVVLANVGLTVLTCGVYWPFAAVALARYRIECMRVEAAGPIERISAAIGARPASAVGDAAADSFGLDIGL